MKRLMLLAAFVFTICTLHAQPPNVPAESGANFGEKVEATKPITPQQLVMIMANKPEKKAEVKLKAVVTEVCSKEGCWIKVQGVNGNVMVKMKDHKFLVPMVLNGKTVIIDGTAEQKTTTVEMLKHYAEDAGKTKAEIDAITEPKNEIIIAAKGILVL